MSDLKALHRFAQFTVLYAAFVIYVGALVKSTGSGMAVPDWPQSFGTWTPKMEGGVFYEHGHRVVAMVLGWFVLALALWAGFVEQRWQARWLLWGALIAVVIQAGLGGLAVLIGTDKSWGHTDPAVITAHACLAQALLAALVTYAAISAPGWGLAERESAVTKSLALQGALLVALVYVQIVLGAIMRHQGAGLVISDFPLNYGGILPHFADGRLALGEPLVALNFAHRVGAWILASAGTFFAWRVVSDTALSAWVRRPAKVLLAAIAVQFFLGASVVWTHLTMPWLTSLHVLGGSVVFTSAVVLSLRLRRSIAAH